VQKDHHSPPAPELLVVNKIDVASEVTLAQLRRALPGAVFVSAHTGEGIDRLRTRLGELVAPREIAVDVTIPYDRGELVARLHDEGRVDAMEHTEQGTRVKAQVPAALAAGLEAFATP
jgi:GTP-binding protein HflX